MTTNEQTTAMPDTLTINGVLYVRADANVPDECAKQACSYFAHYLVYYSADVQGEKLEHAAFHIAEQKCAEVQERMNQWMDAHPNGGQEPAGLIRQCEFWERKVAA